MVLLVVVSLCCVCTLIYLLFIQIAVLLSHRSIISCFAESPFYIFPNWKLLNGDSAEWKLTVDALHVHYVI